MRNQYLCKPCQTRKVTAMGLRQTMLSPLLRSVGALGLVVYIAAQTLCFMHCNFGGGHGDSAPPSCHGAGGTKKCHDACHDEGNSPSPPDGSPTATCFTLMNMLTVGDAPMVVVPEFFVLYFLTPSALALEATATAQEASFSRQANHRNWVLTPEVSLGPALHSLAPPFLS